MAGLDPNKTADFCHLNMSSRHIKSAPAGTVDGTEAVNKQQEGSSTREPVTVDKMVELFESLKDHPQDQNETATVVHVVTVEVDDDDDELEEHQNNKDMPSSGGYLQQNVQRQIPQET